RYRLVVVGDNLAEAELAHQRLDLAADLRRRDGRIGDDHPRERPAADAVVVALPPAVGQLDQPHPGRLDDLLRRHHARAAADIADERLLLAEVALGRVVELEAHVGEAPYRTAGTNLGQRGAPVLAGTQPQLDAERITSFQHL